MIKSNILQQSGLFNDIIIDYFYMVISTIFVPIPFCYIHFK